MRTNDVGNRWCALLLIVMLGFSCAYAQDQPSSTPPSPTDSSQQTPNQTKPEQQPSSTPNSTPPDNPAPQPKEENPNRAQEVAQAAKNLGEKTLEKVRDWESGWFTGPYVSRDRERLPLTGEQRRHIYLEQTLTTPSAYFKRLFAATVDQARDAPPQWPEGWKGYGERFASREGQFITANSLAALGNAALKYEPRYDECRCHGFWPRTRHAIWRNFVTYDESEQHLRPQWALYGGAFAGGVIATQWKPHPRNALANGGIAALEQGGYGAALNFFIEFAGEINRKLGAKK